jgi:hypothetical protein
MAREDSALRLGYPDRPRPMTLARHEVPRRQSRGLTLIFGSRRSQTLAERCLSIGRQDQTSPSAALARVSPLRRFCPRLVAVPAYWRSCGRATLCAPSLATPTSGFRRTRAAGQRQWALASHRGVPMPSLGLPGAGPKGRRSRFEGLYFHRRSINLLSLSGTAFAARPA